MYRPIVLGVCALGSLVSLARSQEIVVDAKIHHLGDSRVTTWPAGAPDPEGLELRLRFEAKRNPAEHCLVIKHFHVDDPWPIVLNGERIGTLEKGKVLRDHVYLIPEGLLRGKNELYLKSRKKSDDILIGEIRVVQQTLRQYLGLLKVRVTVGDPRGRPLPAKLTITDAEGAQLVEAYYAKGLQRAVRKGVVYTSEGVAEFEIPAGDYRIYASRGTEWGVDEKQITVAAGKPATHALRIAREIDTAGFVASDAHIHTLTFSGHGDSSVEERMVTLAGEGVELAISTDHNHNTDYRPYQKKMKLTKHFTSVTGNEVTTKNGHFNAFPLDPKDAVPNWKLADWVKVVDGIRAKGAKVVILNHPRWPRIMLNSPFGKQHFDLNRISGQRKGPEFTFDAMELANSGTMVRDPLFLFVDWFALLNHGDRIMAVGTSDSHTVGSQVGQGRTYLRSSTDVPARIDVDEACKAYRNGFSSISFGLFTDVRVEGAHAMGSTVTLSRERFAVKLRVAAAAWAKPDRARVFVNGRLVADREIVTKPHEPTDAWLEFDIDRPPNDAHLVCVATGPAVRGLFWGAPAKTPYVLGATNPVFLDVDGDKRYQSPRHRALGMLRRYGLDPDKLVTPLQDVDDAVAVQLLGALHENLQRLAGSDAKKRAEALDAVRGIVDRLPGRGVLADYAKSIGK